MTNAVVGIAVASLGLLVGPCDPPDPDPSIEVVDEFTEGPWATQPIDDIWGSPIHVTYEGSERASLICEGAINLGVHVLTSEGGPGVSRDIPVDIPYFAGDYTECVIRLIDSEDQVLAEDEFTIYSPV